MTLKSFELRYPCQDASSIQNEKIKIKNEKKSPKYI